MPISLSPATWESLKESGLTEATVELAGIKDQTTDDITRELLTARKVPSGYFIPYHSVEGAYTGHYRIRVLQNGAVRARYAGPKYLQPARTGNHVYIPPGLGKNWQTEPSVTLFITEGEKKALAAAQAGLTCIGVGGVSSWRNRTIRLPRTAVTAAGEDRNLVLKIDDKTAQMIEEQVAPEMLEITWTGRQVVIIFDSDTNDNPDVQDAAFELALWLEDRGAEVGQFTLVAYEDGRKCGLDDFLRDEPDALEQLETGELTYPTPPQPRRWMSEELDSGKSGRLVQRRVARVALACLDKWGQRYKDDGGNYYYFDSDSKVLHPFRFDNLPQLRSTSFGTLLANDLGIHTADTPTVSRLADMFSARDPVPTITPHRVVTTVGDILYYQLSDGRVARVSAESIDLVDNGTDDVLFLPNEVEPIDEDELVRELDSYDGSKTPLWLDSIGTLRLEPLPGISLEATQQLLACLFYLSPWLNRWRRLMPPLEVAVAEPNSGKTFLYNLRRGILTGKPDLEGLPDDFRGWVSSVSSAPALWVCDNLGGVRTDFWHRLNDELARLITDPTPTVELRQLYTTASVYRVPVQAAFAVTTIKNPFTAPDILQRALIYHLRAIPAQERDGNWYYNQLQRRPLWVAEHLLIIQEFFRLVQSEWNDKYLSGFRLVNFEQGLYLIGKALGFDLKGIIKQLPSMVSATVAEYDPVVEALVAFVAEYERPMATISQVVDWVQGDVDRRYSNIKTLDNSILLGRYINSHTYDIEQATGLQIIKRHNQTVLKMPERENA